MSVDQNVEMNSFRPNKIDVANVPTKSEYVRTGAGRTLNWHECELRDRTMASRCTSFMIFRRMSDFSSWKFAICVARISENAQSLSDVASEMHADFSLFTFYLFIKRLASLSLVDRNCCHCVVVYFSPLLPPSTPHVLTHSARLLANQFLRCALLQFFFLYLLLKWVGCECIANAVRSKDMAVCGRTAPHSHRDKFSIERLQNDVRQKYSNIFNNNRLFVRFCTWWRPRRHCRKISPHIKRTSAFNCFFFYFGFRLIQKLNDKLLSGAFRLDYFILPVAFPFC